MSTTKKHLFDNMSLNTDFFTVFFYGPKIKLNIFDLVISQIVPIYSTLHPMVSLRGIENGDVPNMDPTMKCMQSRPCQTSQKTNPVMAVFL